MAIFSLWMILYNYIISFMQVQLMFSKLTALKKNNLNAISLLKNNKEYIFQ